MTNITLNYKRIKYCKEVLNNNNNQSLINLFRG